MGLIRTAVCDCCGNTIIDAMYFISISAESVNLGTAITTEAAATNLYANLSQILPNQHRNCYCAKCIHRLKKEYNL